VAAISVHRFRKRHPEFQKTPDELVEQMLAQADERINDDAFVTNENARSATMYLAAHFLSVSPDGEPARTVLNKNDTIYGAEYHRMVRAFTMGRGRVA